MSDTTVKAWLIVKDDDGDPRTKCPHCGKLDTINEHDTAVRWNRLNLVSDDGLTATASLGDSGEWDGDGWICTDCLSTELVAPEGFEITEWF